MTEGRSEKGEEGTPLIPYKASGLPLSSTFLGQGSYHLSLQSVTFRSKHFSFFFFFFLPAQTLRRLFYLQVLFPCEMAELCFRGVELGSTGGGVSGESEWPSFAKWERSKAKPIGCRPTMHSGGRWAWVCAGHSIVD